MKMERSFYLNGKPLVQPPLSIDQQLNERLARTGYKIEDINRLNERPVLSIIDLDGLTSGYLNNNQIFQMLKQEIMTWNERVTLHRAQQIELKDPFVYENLYRQLKNSLLEVVSTRNRQQQLEFLNKVSTWFFRQLPKSQKQQLTQSLIEKNDNTLQYMPTAYNESMYASGIEDYKSRNRSMHPDIDPPEDRVKSYHRKNLLSDTSTRPGTTPGIMGFSQYTRPQTSQTTYKMIDQVDKFSRPMTNQQYSVTKQQSSWMYDTNFPVFETFEEQQKSTRRQIPKEESPLKADKPTDRDQMEGIEQEQDEDEEQSPDKVDASQKNIQSQVDLSPKKKKKKKERADKYVSIAPDRKTYKTDKDTELAYQIGQNQRLGELQGIFHNYDPTNLEDKMAAARLNQYYQEQRIKELKEQREDIEMVENMKVWATNKGRIDEIILQSEYLQSMGSQFSNVGIKVSDIYESKKMDLAEEKAYANYLNKTSYHKGRTISSSLPITKVIENTVLPTQVDDEAEDFQSKNAYLEQRINSQRLYFLKRSRGSWLPGGVPNHPSAEKIQNNRSLSSSCFRSVQPSKQFSTVFKSHSIKSDIDQQISEINVLKNRLASEKRFVPITILQKSLVIPQGHLNPQKVPLPKPGILLANIPDTGKKTRGKKKKSKK
ncbi:unnamed protein product (macronuclear) [Paramecium tetraurelia]|uniref:Uncharacterized protein n=1 Tax=Paramecium tetraurelia TaxID=5888 RepID=A0DQE5_PARTE|nr:uncharacterized protein GSPATT00002662001 [Paramecium tetraurelia]CAK85262.1 unnamed protein product [Paramecium tetraurelia]|eukprot:XP_001452659.1 hypothetical protein (macronuclear) [Paramecium tetraurelia strain d4-2]